MLPFRLYEALPAVYVCVGVSAMIAAENVLGVASGALLAAVGAIVFRMRRTYRRAR